jgi:hypothetical protein
VDGPGSYGKTAGRRNGAWPAGGRATMRRTQTARHGQRRRARRRRPWAVALVAVLLALPASSARAHECLHKLAASGASAVSTSAHAACACCAPRVTATSTGASEEHPPNCPAHREQASEALATTHDACRCSIEQAPEQAATMAVTAQAPALNQVLIAAIAAWSPPHVPDSGRATAWNRPPRPPSPQQMLCRWLA